jgi:hypothetical protein
MKACRSASRRLSESLVVIVVALPVAGCGGSGAAAPKAASQAVTASTAHHSSQGDTARPRFIAAADAICNRLNIAIADPPGTVLNNSNLARLAPRHAVLEKKAVSQLSTLTAPASMASDWLKILADRRTLARELARLGIAAKANDAAAITKLGVSKARVHQRLGTLASHDGFVACGRAGGSTAPPLSPPARSGPGRSI